MPTLRADDVTRAAELLLRLLQDGGPGSVLAYADLAKAMKADIARGAMGKRHLHLLRAAAERLREEGKAELWGHSLRDGWRLDWIRVAGRGENPPPPKPRKKWRPPVPYRGQFVVAPELLARVEQAVLDVLAGPHDARELLIASGFAPAPGEGFVHYHYLTSRVGNLVELHPSSRLNVIGKAVRSLAAKGKVTCVGRKCRDGKMKLKWVRLAAPGEEPACPAPCFLMFRAHPEPSRL